jgi:phosphohistidine phosphatase
MTNLILLRHGIALPPGTPGMADDDRPLTEKGERRMVEIGQALARLDLKLDRIVTSPLPRARRTAEIVARELGLSERLEHADELRAGRSASAIRSWVESRPEESLMIVGHNPAFSDLAALLLGLSALSTAIELRKGGIAAFHRESGAYSLDWLATPRVLRRLND